MSDSNVDRNIEIVQNLWNGMFIKRDMSVVKQTLGPNYTFNGEPATAQGTIDWATKLFTIIPDLTFEIQIILGSGDQVAHRWQGGGTLNLPHNKQLNGKPIQVNGTNISEIDSDGWMISNWQTPAQLLPSGPPEQGD